MIYFDSHCHMNADEFAGDVPGYLTRARTAGVQTFLVVGWDAASSRRAVALAEQYDGVYAAVGIHPTEIHASFEEDFLQVTELLKHPKVVALGEIGLDFYWQKTEAEHKLQKEAFARQIRLANQAHKPIVVHARDAMQETLRVLEENPPISGVMHCYGGSAEMVPAFLGLNLYISLGGPVTFKNARVSKEVALKVPLSRLLIETDAPYLAPHPFRGTQNESARLPLIAAEIAAIRHESIEAVVTQTTKNSEQLFHVKPHENHM